MVVTVDKDEHDFGFSFSDDRASDLDSELKRLNIKVMDLEDAAYNTWQLLNPFFENLMKNPDKAMIKWPDRLKKVSAFSSKIKDVLNPPGTLNN